VTQGLAPTRSKVQSGEISPTMSKRPSAWLLAWTIIAWHQYSLESDSDGSGADLANVTAQLGRFRNFADQSANDADLAARLGALGQILALIWLWNCAKYRARLPEIRVNRAGNFQMGDASDSTPIPSQTLAQHGFQGLAHLVTSQAPPVLNNLLPHRPVRLAG
jgi:hypothetical protein